MNLLLTGAFKYSEEHLYRVRSIGYDVMFVQDERDHLPIDLDNIDAVVCNNLFLYKDIKQFRNLKFIQLTSAGMDRVPLDYINDRGIIVYNARGVYSTPIAEWVVLKILEIYKKSRKFYDAQSEHKWLKQRDLMELTGKTAAIIGFGSVGTAIAKRLKAFEVNLIAVDDRSRDSAESLIVNETYRSDELIKALGKSDIAVLTLPLTAQTCHLMNKSKFDAMKYDSVLVNVSRGAVIDESALISVLQEGKLLGAALDVFEEEPLPENSLLWDFENVIITPHNSFVSDKVNERLFEVIFKNLCFFKSNSRE